jgi:hypothetical protein
MRGFSLERFQEKWMPLFRFENATNQRHGAFVLMQSKREMLQAQPARKSGWSGRLVEEATLFRPDQPPYGTQELRRT